MLNQGGEFPSIAAAPDCTIWSEKRSGPVMGIDAFTGPAGDLANACAQDSEADAAACLVQMLALSGAKFGRQSWISVGQSQHHPRLFVAVVGPSSSGRKGTSLSAVKSIFREAERIIAADKSGTGGLREDLQITSGISSGEGIVYAVRDPRWDNDEDGNWVIVDNGVDDKRLLLAEPELAQLFEVSRRSGNIISSMVRQAWDGDDLGIVTRVKPLKATEPHISLIGHITPAELRAKMGGTDVSNGLANRFVWAWSQRSRSVPEPHPLPAGVVRELAQPWADAVIWANRRSGAMKMDADASEFWADQYAFLSADRPGTLGPLAARGPAQVLRIALIYALLDRSQYVRAHHLAAGVAVWRYCLETCQHIFGESQVDPVAQKILDALADSEAGQLDRLFIRNSVLSKHVSAPDMDRALADLTSQGLIAEVQMKGRGRPRRAYRLVIH